MFKKIILSAVILLSSISATFAADLKVGVFDERMVLSKAPQIELIDTKLEKQFAERITEMKTLNEKLIALQEKAKRDGLTMTEAQKIALQREGNDIKTSLQSKNKNLQEDFQRAKQAEVQKIRIQIQQIVSKLAKAEGYDLILRVETVAFQKAGLDISNKVITILSNPAG